MPKMTKEEMKKEMIDEIQVMDESSRLLDEYNYLFGKQLTPDDVSDYED